MSDNETKLKDYKRDGKTLIPPLAQIPMKTSSWVNDRLPEMLWAGLILGEMDREKALDFFRYIADFVSKNNDCSDITISGIGAVNKSLRRDFIKHILSYNSDIKVILRPLMLFEQLPAYSDWHEILGSTVPKEDWNKIANAVNEIFFHQSQKVTDCRWLRVFSLCVAGKLYCPSENIKEIVNYPNYGDLRAVRPFMRAMEITLEYSKINSNWSEDFWKVSFDQTECFPEITIDTNLKEECQKMIDKFHTERDFYLKDSAQVWHDLIDYFLNQEKTSDIDPRFEGVFGLALYGISLFCEVILYQTPSSITSRINLRTLIEIYITLAYLLKKEKVDNNVWDTYRQYGTGQLNLIYQKQKTATKKINCIEIERLRELANENKWIEFVPINVGHWDSLDLRKMSEEVGLKDIYDEYYNYTSGFIHGSWGAIRESIYQKCMNPLHRYHSIPVFEFPLMPSTIDDSIDIINKILDQLSIAYPKFDSRIKQYKEESTTPNR